MSMDKWLDDKDTTEEKKLREDTYAKLSKEERKDLKVQKIRKIVQKNENASNKNDKKTEFLNSVIEFKDWLINRSYIKGDLERIETWVANLYLILTASLEQQREASGEFSKKNLLNNYKSIPVNFLDEKTRIALNKKLKNTTKTTSDNYYLRKLKNLVKEKLKEAEYYEILRDILDS
jgi:hypothetical protein